MLNQYNTRIITENIQSFHHIYKKTSVHEPFIDVTHFSNPAENKHTDTTDDSHTDNEDYVDKINVKRDEDKYDKYKGDISEYSKNDEIVINKT